MMTIQEIVYFRGSYMTNVASNASATPANPGRKPADRSQGRRRGGLILLGELAPLVGASRLNVRAGRCIENTIHVSVAPLDALSIFQVVFASKSRGAGLFRTC
jgi:hypothetical protein